MPVAATLIGASGIAGNAGDALCLRHERASCQPAGDHPRTAQSDRRRHCRQRGEGARGAQARVGATAPISSFSPNCSSAGYPPEDLVLKPAFQAACRAAVESLARETADGGPAMIIGTPWVEDGKLYNAVALLDGG